MSAAYDQLIYDTAIKQGFTPTSAKFIVAQSRYETADYTSNVFKLNNNTGGMKFIGQPLATRGTPAPKSEQRCNGGCDSDYYAKFKSVADSAKDVIERLYNIPRKGVTPQQLKAAQTPEEFARLLKIRGYYGGSETSYAAGLKVKLLKIQIVEFVTKNKKSISLLLLGLVAAGAAYYFYTKKK